MIRWLFVLMMLSSTAYCQQLLEGKVVDAETGKPVPFASIGVVGTSKGTSSNLNGQFSLTLSGPVSLKVTCVGYESRTINSSQDASFIQLKPKATQLTALVFSNKAINARKIVKKAFASIRDNYNDESFLQTFFYRHYCKDDSVYGRLIEASVDVWKRQGYRSMQKSAGDKEEIRVTHLRRSLDKTNVAQGHEPISIKSALEADVVAYQTPEKSLHSSFFTEVSNLQTDFQNYTFTFTGVTVYDGLEVYQIDYSYKKDSVLTTSGTHQPLTSIDGSLFITTDSYAIVKTDDIKYFGQTTLRTSAYYRKYEDRYFPYHLIREGESLLAGNHTHSFRIDMMSVEIKKSTEKFTGSDFGKEALLAIPYDSIFWSNNTILKTTPLEDEIIRDLGGGASLNMQFYIYYLYEMNVREGGKNAVEKFNWLRDYYRGKRILYLVFWSDAFKPYLADMEYAKRLNKRYRNKITFVFLSLDDDDARWQQTVTRFNYSSDGIINYRIGSNSPIAKQFNVKQAPAFILISRSGETTQLVAKSPSNPALEEDFKIMLNQ